jgi:hypothetical protein
MSFWNENNYKVRLVDFVERFVAHNKYVRLFTTERVENDDGLMETIYNLLWKGMDWQITEGYADSDYFKFHTDVKPCPYGEWNVIGVTNVGTNSDFADEVSLIIEEL